MKTESKALGKCSVELKVNLDADELKKVVKKVENAFVREVRLPGFRPGKVPLEMIRSRFAKELSQETQREMLASYLKDAIAAEKLDEVAVTEAKDFSQDADGAAFTAVVEVKPEFTLPTYKGLKIEQRDTTVTDEALGQRIEALRAAYATYEDAKEGETIADGDFAQIDYSGTVDGKPISEIAPEATIVAARTNFWVQLEEGRFLPEILAALKGMKVGETKNDVKAVFDKNAAPDPLKGAEALYTVTLKAFRRRLLPTDDVLAEKTKSENFDRLVANTREQMEKAAVNQEAVRRENEAVEMLLKKVDFDVPSAQVRSTRDNILQQFAERAQYSGMGAEYFEKNSEKILKDAEDRAIRQVRLWYIIDAIAKAENIPEGDDRGKKVMDLILANAK